MSEVVEEINIIPLKKVVKKKDTSEKRSSSFYPNRHENMPREMRFPDEQKELPVDEWIMPDQPHGYIKGRDKDLL